MEGWRETTIKDEFYLGRGRVISQSEIEDNDGIYPVYSSQSTNKGEMGKISTFDFEGEYITWTTDGAYAGTVFHRNGKFNCTNVCGTLKAIDETKIDHLFVAYLLSTISKGHVSYVGNPKLMNGVMSKIPISIPYSLKEQKKIASILSTIDQTIDQTEQLIAKYKNIKQGLMHDLLTYGIDENGTIRNPGTHIFVVKKGLVVPEEWEVDSLGSCFDNFKSGNSITSENIFNIAHYPVYGGNGLRGYTNTYTHSGKYVLIGRQGALCGNINLVTGENYISEHAIAVLTNANNNIYYWYYKLDHMNLNQYSAQSAQPGLAVEKLIKLIVCIPQRHEQEKISQILNKQDSLIESEQTDLAKLQNLKQGLMADLLTGKVRVKI